MRAREIQDPHSNLGGLRHSSGSEEFGGAISTLLAVEVIKLDGFLRKITCKVFDPESGHF